MRSPLQRDHRAEGAVVHRVDGGDAEAGREDAVVRGGRAAAQHVAEDRDPGLEPGAPLDLVLDHVADATEAHVAELVDLAALHRERALLRHRALGDHHDREVRALAVPVLDARAHVVDVERHLGHQHDVGAAGDAGVDRDPPRVAAHHLDHHHPVVALRRGVQPVDGIGRDLHRGVEAEGEVGGGEVVVDRLGHADHRDARLVAQPGGHAEGVLAADGDERVDLLASPASRAHAPTPSSVWNGLVRDVPRMVPPRWISPRVVAMVSSTRLVVDHAAPAVAEPDDLVAVQRFALADDGADHRVEPRAVAPPVSMPMRMTTSVQHRRYVRSMSDAAPGPAGTRAWYTKVSAESSPAVRGSPLRRRGRDRRPGGGARRAAAHVLLQAPARSLEVVRVRNGLLLQVLVRDQERNTHVFEFRPRRHHDGRALADALR